MRLLLTTIKDEQEIRNPIAILDLAAYYRMQGHTVDCYYLQQLEAGAAAGRQYDWVGLSVLYARSQEAILAAAAYLKKTFQAKIVVGGKHMETLTPMQIEEFRALEVEVYPGKGELYFSQEAIDYQSYPSWSREDFKTLEDVRIDVMSSRGCPHHCYFCHNTEQQVHFFSPRRTADNVELLFLLGAPEIFFVDDIFTVSAGHMEAVYTELKRRKVAIERRSIFFTHVNYVRPGTLTWMNAFKPRNIHIGIESGDRGMLERMGKNITPEKAFGAVKSLYDNGHKVVVLFMLGFPGETQQSLRATYQFIKSVSLMIHSCWVSFYQPVPGTRGYTLAQERVGRVSAGKKNFDVTYVEPGLSPRMLRAYRRLIYAACRYPRLFRLFGNTMLPAYFLNPLNRFARRGVTLPNSKRKNAN